MTKQYLFTSARLGFRNWEENDIALMAAINAHPGVMEYFPSTQTHEQTTRFIARMQQQFADKGYCYFAVDILDTIEFIGFIGLSEPTYEAYFTPCVDIGWRLDKKVWNKGYATEGAKRCLEYGFNQLKLPKIYATAPKVNLKSQRIMQKIGMVKASEFIHPVLHDNQRLRECVLFEKHSE